MIQFCHDKTILLWKGTVLKTLLKLFLLSIILSGCAGSGIARESYSLLENPQETFAFAKKAVAHDDPKAFYYCLTQRTQEQFKLSDLELGWALAGSFFYLFLEAKLKDVEIPAPEKMFQANPNTAKLTLETNSMQASFLFYREKEQWKLVFPSPYPLPDVSKIKKRENLPWRRESLVYYQNRPEDWYKPSIEKIKIFVPETRKPLWRIQTEDALLFSQIVPIRGGEKK